MSLEPIPSDTLSTQIIDIGMSKCIQDNASDFTTYQETNRSEKQIVNGKYIYQKINIILLYHRMNFAC